MNNFEASFFDKKFESPDETLFENSLSVGELIEKKVPEISQESWLLFKKITTKYPYLKEIRIIFVSPEDEPETGGLFNVLEIDQEIYFPTVYIVEDDEKHMSKLLKLRQSSNEEVARLMEIEFSRLTPELLKRFIIAHEMGHAKDYMVNYNNNPLYGEGNPADEWNFHYESVLSSLPVPGLDPVELSREIAKFSDLDQFLKYHPEVVGFIRTNNISFLADLLRAQELAYRNSEYEKYADTFAVEMINS